MKHLILGQGKSGSSALFFSICEQIKECTRIFEPVPMEREALQPDDVVVKKLIEFFTEEEKELLPLFDKKIFLVRDPRDSLVSRLLYIVWDRQFVYDDAKLNIFLDALKKKEQDPESISLVELYSIMDQLDNCTVINAVKRLNKMTMDCWNEHGSDFRLFKYEDYIQGNLTELNDYLGLNIQNDVVVPKGVRRVARKKSFGDWKNWFTEEDKAYIATEFAEIMEAFNYDPDEPTNTNKIIQPEFSSQYVQRIAREKRAATPR